SGRSGHRGAAGLRAQQGSRAPHQARDEQLLRLRRNQRDVDLLRLRGLKPRRLRAPSMQCPYCRDMESRVVDSRLVTGGTVTWRRRECDGCKRRFTTYERVETTLPTVVKKDGQRVAFDRQKILRSLHIACNKRPVSAETLDEQAEQLERELGESGEK